MSRQRTRSIKSFIIVGVVILLIAGGAFLFFSDFLNSDGETEHGANDVSNVQPRDTQNTQQNAEDVVRDLEVTLNAILGRSMGEQQGYIIGTPMVNAMSIFNDDAIAEKVSAVTEYEIIEIQVEYDTAIVTLSIFDAYD